MNIYRFFLRPFHRYLIFHKETNIIIAKRKSRITTKERLIDRETKIVGQRSWYSSILHVVLAPFFR